MIKKGECQFLLKQSVLLAKGFLTVRMAVFLSFLFFFFSFFTALGKKYHYFLYSLNNLI